MTVPRREIVDESVSGVYHYISRCVRRACLCGYDTVQGRSFDHRKEWVRDRLQFLGDIFAVDLLAYAVMSNHLHTVLRNRPEVAAEWSPQEGGATVAEALSTEQREREVQRASRRGDSSHSGEPDPRAALPGEVIEY